MADQRPLRRWLGYDWFKLIIALLLLLLMFWVRPGAATTSAVAAPTATSPAATAMPVAPTLAPSATPEPAATASPMPIASPTAMATIAPTASPVPTATPAATETPQPAAEALAITAPRAEQQLPSGPITIAGTGPAGAKIEVLNGDQVIATLTVQPDGTWSTTYTPDRPGPAALSIRPVGGEASGAPVQVTIEAAVAVSPSCTTLAVGCDAWVTRVGGQALRVRSSPGTDQPIIKRLPSGTQLTLIEGPRSAGSLTWWRVTTAGGDEGWVNGENLVLQAD